MYHYILTLIMTDFLLVFLIKRKNIEIKKVQILSDTK